MFTIPLLFKSIAICYKLLQELCCLVVKGGREDGQGRKLESLNTYLLGNMQWRESPEVTNKACLAELLQITRADRSVIGNRKQQ